MILWIEFLAIKSSAVVVSFGLEKDSLHLIQAVIIFTVIIIEMLVIKHIAVLINVIWLQILFPVLNIKNGVV